MISIGDLRAYISGNTDFRQRLADEASQHGDHEHAQGLLSNSAESVSLAAEGLHEMAREGHDKATKLVQEAEL